MSRILSGLFCAALSIACVPSRPAYAQQAAPAASTNAGILKVMCAPEGVVRITSEKKLVAHGSNPKDRSLCELTIDNRPVESFLGSSYTEIPSEGLKEAAQAITSVLSGAVKSVNFKVKVKSNQGADHGNNEQWGYLGRIILNIGNAAVPTVVVNRRTQALNGGHDGEENLYFPIYGDRVYTLAIKAEVVQNPGLWKSFDTISLHMPR